MSITTTSRYENDTRVTAYEIDDGGVWYSVRTDDGQTFEVLYTDVCGWVICEEGDNPNPIPVAGGGLAVNISSADGAIAALIGDPR